MSTDKEPAPMVCTDPRHETPCSGNCIACRTECDPWFMVPDPALKEPNLAAQKRDVA